MIKIAWDDIQTSTDLISNAEWNNMVTDQKTRVTASDVAGSGYIKALDEDTSPSLVATLDASEENVEDAKIVTFHQEISNGSSGSTATIDWGAGQKQAITLSDDCTFSFTAPSNGIGNFMFRMVQDSTGGHTAAWPSTVLWATSTDPVITSTVSATDIAAFYFNGTNYYGTISQNFG